MAVPDPPPKEETQIKIKPKLNVKNTQPSVLPTICKDNEHAVKDIFKEHEEIFTGDYNNKTNTVVSIDQKEKYYVSGTKNITGKIASLIEKINGIWSCKVCGKAPARSTPSEIEKTR